MITGKSIRPCICTASWLALSVTGACSSPTEKLDSGAQPSADAGEIDATTAPDAAPGMDAASLVDAAPPPRSLVRKTLFGDMPNDNLVMDPEFDLMSANWFGATDQSAAELRRRFEAKAPTGQPLLFVPRNAVNTGAVFVMGTAETAGEPMKASLWIGRLEHDRTATISVSLLTVTASGAAAAADLMFDAGAHVMTLEGIVWTKYTATIGDPGVGWIHPFIVDSSNAPFFVSGPLIRPQSAAFADPLGRDSAVWRPARAMEQRALGLMRKRTLERFVGVDRSRQPHRARSFQ
jgi:hypothetical protein